MLIAVTRPVSASIDRCELTYLGRQPIDLALARAQHAGYEEALTRLGARVVRLPGNDELPDATFVEDAAVVLDELAIVPVMGAPSRRPESAEVARCLGRFRPLRRLEPPGTLDGGDVVVAERTVYVGRTQRTDDAGIAQLRRVLEPHGYAVVRLVPTGCLHLKSACTYLGRRTVLANPQRVDVQAFEGMKVIEVAPEEPGAANAVGLAGTLVFPGDFPRTRERLEAEGFTVIPVEVSEIRKAEAAVSCMSLLFDADLPQG